MRARVLRDQILLLSMARMGPWFSGPVSIRMRAGHGVLIRFSQSNDDLWQVLIVDERDGWGYSHFTRDLKKWVGQYADRVACLVEEVS